MPRGVWVGPVVMVMFGLFSASTKSANASVVQEPVRILSWYDYLAPEVIDRIKKIVPGIEIETYKSNEMALGQLLSGPTRLDIAILSNLLIPVAIEQGVIERGLFAKDKRNYEPFLSDVSADCLPFSWFSTIFAYDSRGVKSPPNSLPALMALRDQGFNISLMDDMFEISGRALLDSSDMRCRQKSLGQANAGKSGSVLEPAEKCQIDQVLPSQLRPSPSDFLTSVTEVMTKEKSAAYGCQGEIAPALKDRPWIKLALAEQAPVVGYDVVCVIKKPRDRQRLKLMADLVRSMTERESILMATRFNQYFPPYRGMDQSLNPQLKELRSQLIERIRKNEAVFLNLPTKAAHARLSEWWNGVRIKAK